MIVRLGFRQKKRDQANSPGLSKVMSMKLNWYVGQVGFKAHLLSWLSIVATAMVLSAGMEVRAASIQPLEIVTKSGVHVFAVEMATTEEEKTTGLMYRKELADGKGNAVRLLARAGSLDVDEKHLHPARHDIHPRRRPDPANCPKTPNRCRPGSFRPTGWQRGCSR